jgi:Clp amino terminal domain, pathogenicity island component/UvrB/uvrC motif
MLRERRGLSMFERFTERARRAVVLAQEEARKLDHGYIGTEHLLLGLIHEGEGVAAQALESLGISLKTVRDQVVARVGRGQRPPSGHIPFTERAKRVLELSLRESGQLGHRYIGTEHILLAIVREGDGIAAQVLTGLGADLGRVRQQVIELLHGRTDEGPRSGPGRRDAPAGGPAGDVPPDDEITDWLGALNLRLAAIERWVGMRPDVDDLDENIARVRRDKEAAIDVQNFEDAVRLRDRERELLAEKDERAKEWTAGPGLADEVGRLSAEVSRLRSILRDHGIEPGGGAA